MSSAALKSMKSHNSVFKWSTCALVRGLPCYNRFYRSRSCQLEPLKKYVFYYKLPFEPWRFRGKTRPSLQPFISTVLLPLPTSLAHCCSEIDTVTLVPLFVASQLVGLRVYGRKHSYKRWVCVCVYARLHVCVCACVWKPRESALSTEPFLLLFKLDQRQQYLKPIKHVSLKCAGVRSLHIQMGYVLT